MDVLIVMLVILGLVGVALKLNQKRDENSNSGGSSPGGSGSDGFPRAK